ncbi:MAG TPA: pyruvate synthase subunit PorB [Desulfobacteraceae bacterium]|nr:pyruvate synthase subunit PorB [Desulfobacteraceae bacterium]HPJ67423.1 pyruvate synthase subunit PorB [Desulfobacteraceae bacterium]HPQ28761.1 pyruvate synthase subunit PorB [Desulfobacteraceae bacterium]
MESTNVYAYKLITRKEYFSPGHRACQGCAEALAVRLVAKAMGRDTIVASATGCMEIISSPMPFTNWRVPWIHVAFENAAAVASGVEAGIKVLMRKGRIPKKRINFLAMAGDGGTSDIGVQALSGALERGHDFTYICYDNEAYMNTGIQRSSSTPFGAATTTSPAGRVVPGQITWKKNMPEIAAAHNIPYVATACPSYPVDLIEKVKKAAGIKGPAYVHILSVCPTGWRLPPHQAIKAGRFAVETGIFPLYEVEKGRYRFTVKIGNLRPVGDYLKMQGRFSHLDEKLIDTIQKRVDKEYGKLKKKIEQGD